MDNPAYEIQSVYNPTAATTTNSYLYVKIGCIALISSLIAAGVVYYVKPNAFMKIKNDPESGVDLGLVALVCIGVFAVVFGACFLLYRTVWSADPVSIAQPPPQNLTQQATL